MRPVLMVAYYYPPAGGAGVQRTLKFTRYLPEFGWRPHVLVPDAPDYPVRDESLLDEVGEDVVVHRSRIFEPYGAYRRITGRSGGSLDVATVSRDAGERARLSERVAEWVRETFFIPDARAGWYPFAVSKGRSVIADVKPHAIYSSAPPYTTHLIGRALHRRSGIPWVADFRDSWVDWVTAPTRRGISRRIDLGFERKVLRDASRVLTVSEGVADDLASRHPGARGSHWEVLTNGYDPADLGGISPDRGGVSGDRLLVTHVGTLYGPRNPSAFLSAWAELLADGHPAAAALRFRIVGRVADTIRREIESGPLADRVDFVGYVDHARAVAATGASDVMLLVIDDTPQSRGILTGKLFEYLGLEKPILAIAPDGEAASLVERLDAGVVATPRDPASARSAIVALHERWARGALRGADPAELVPFQRRELTRRLAAVLDDAAGAGGSHRNST